MMVASSWFVVCRAALGPAVRPRGSNKGVPGATRPFVRFLPQQSEGAISNA